MDSPAPERSEAMDTDGSLPVDEGRFRYRDADLVYERAGAGPLAVYTHGGFVSQAVETEMGLFGWEPVVRAGRCLIRYDVRGHGRSTGEPMDRHYTYPSLADDLLAVLDHVRPGEPAAALGSSMGCGVVLHAAVRAPERFSRLVLLIPPTAWETRPAYAQSNRETADLVERQGVRAWHARSGGDRPRPAAIADVPEFPPTPPERLLPSVLRGLAASDLPKAAAVARLRHPTLILTWADDPGHPLSTAEGLVDALPNAELYVSQSRTDIRTWGERIAAHLTA